LNCSKSILQNQFFNGSILCWNILPWSWTRRTLNLEMAKLHVEEVRSYADMFWSLPSFDITFPCARFFVLNIHLIPIALIPRGSVQSSQVLFLSMKFITSIQNVLVSFNMHPAMLRMVLFFSLDTSFCYDVCGKVSWCTTPFYTCNIYQTRVRYTLHFYRFLNASNVDNHFISQLKSWTLLTYSNPLSFLSANKPK